MRRMIAQTEFGPVTDTFIGDVPDYVLLVRLEELKVPQLEEILPSGYARTLIYNMGDRRCYSFHPHLISSGIVDLTAKLLELEVQSFEFRDRRNREFPPIRERTIPLKRREGSHS